MLGLARQSLGNVKNIGRLDAFEGHLHVHQVADVGDIPSKILTISPEVVINHFISRCEHLLFPKPLQIGDMDRFCFTLTSLPIFHHENLYLHSVHTLAINIRHYTSMKRNVVIATPRQIVPEGDSANVDRLWIHSWRTKNKIHVKIPNAAKQPSNDSGTQRQANIKRD